MTKAYQQRRIVQRWHKRVPAAGTISVEKMVTLKRSGYVSGLNWNGNRCTLVDADKPRFKKKVYFLVKVGAQCILVSYTNSFKSAYKVLHHTAGELYTTFQCETDYRFIAFKAVDQYIESLE